MRRSILLVAALATTLALSACGSDSGGNDSSATPSGSASTGASAEATDAAAAEGALTIWVDESRKAPVEAAAAVFESETKTKVNIVQKNFDDIRKDFLAQVPTGKGPDITVGAHDWLGELTQNGVVAPLELGDVSAKFEKVSVEAFTKDGQVYGLPYAIENIALIRNTKLAPAAPATWDDAVAVGKAAGTKYSVLIQSDGESGDPYTFYPLQTSFGAPVFKQNADGSYTDELAMGGDPGHAFANWLKAQGDAGVLSVDNKYDIIVEAFAKGEAPFIIGGPWMLEKFTDITYAIDPIPSAGGQPAQPFVGVAGFYLNAQSKNKLTANDFLVNYMSTEDAQMALYKAGNRPPALTAAADKAAAEDPVVAGFRTVGVSAVPMPSIPAMSAVWTFWGNTEAAIFGKKAADPVAAWDKMMTDIQAAIDKQ